MLEIEVKNKRKIAGSNEKMKNIVSRVLRRVKSDTAEDFVQIAQVYPPESEANSAPPPFWQRGVGKIRSVGGTPNPASQQLGSSWSVTHARQDEIMITNPTTYAPWVHGNKKQAWFHKLRGWKTVQQMFSMLGIHVDQDNNANITSSDSIGKRILTEIAQFTRDLFN